MLRHGKGSGYMIHGESATTFAPERDPDPDRIYAYYAGFREAAPAARGQAG